MTTVATLHTDLLDVAPGTEVTCGLDIRNAGEVVESYRLEVLGDAAAWTAVEPPTVSAFPGDATQVLLLFRPPRNGRVPAGDVPFAVRVTPSQHPETAAVPEGVVRVLPYHETAAELKPRTSKGQRSARHEVAVDNRGNVPLSVQVSGADPDDALTITARPAVLTIGPGQAVFTKVRVRNRRLRWRGQPETRPFQVMIAPEETGPAARHTAGPVPADEPPPMTLDGTTLQLSVIPRGTGRVLAGLLVLALLGTGLWFGLLKPTVASVAKEAAEEALAEPLAELSAQSSQAAADAASAQSAVEELGLTAAEPSPAADGDAAGSGEVFRHRFETVVGANGTVISEPIVTPENTTLVITDLFLQNPQGDSGRLDILVDDVDVNTEALQNFRNLDYHLVTPIEVPAGESLAIRTRCGEPGPALPPFTGSSCRTFVLVIGFLRVEAPPETIPASAP